MKARLAMKVTGREAWGFPYRKSTRARAWRKFHGRLRRRLRWRRFSARLDRKCQRRQKREEQRRLIEFRERYRAAHSGGSEI
jgi:hypothetical protein